MAAATRPRVRDSQQASGTPSTVATAVAMVALTAEVATAAPSPGTPKPRSAEVAKRTANATSGTSRYSASSPPSQASGLRGALRPAHFPGSTSARPAGTPVPVTPGGVVRVKPSCSQRGEPLRAEQVADERLRAGLVRCAADDGDGVGGLQVLAGDRRPSGCPPPFASLL